MTETTQAPGALGSFQRQTPSQKPKLNRSEILNRAMEACQEDNSTGICLACGADADGVEPDARKYECEVCGQATVYGCEEIVVRLDK